MMAGYGLSGACENMPDAMGCGSAVRIASDLPQPWRLPVRRVCIAEWRRCCWLPRGRLWPRPPAAAMSTAPVCTAGWGSMAHGGMQPRLPIGRGVAGRGRAVGSRHGGWRQCWPVTRAAAATWPRAGRCRCWCTTWLRRRALPSALGHCGADFTRRTIANRGSLETVIPAVPEEACGILCGDAAECRTDRGMQGVDRARADLAQLGLELGPGGLD